MRLRGGKKLIPPTNLQESDNEGSLSTNNISSSYAEPPPFVNNKANGTFGPNLNDSDSDTESESKSESDSCPGFDATFAPGTPQTELSNRTVWSLSRSSGASACSCERCEEIEMYKSSKQIVVDPNMPVQAKIGSLTTIEGLINADKEIPASLVEECFIKNLGRILWKHLEPITPICGTILNILSKIISCGGQHLVQKHLTIPLQKLAKKRDIINQANKLLNLLPNP